MNTDFCAFASTSSFWNSPSNFRAVHQKSNSFFSDYLPHNCFQYFLSPKTALDILYAALGSAPLSQKRGFIRA